jgi:hypothetical protein
VFTLVIAAVAGIAAFAVSRLTAVHVPFLSDTCRVFAGDDVVRVSPEQLTHAATITAVAARRRLPDRAATIALATALQESKLRNLPSGDRDSVGLFQQRPSQGWGTPEQLQSPRYAASRFYDHLVRVRGWQTMRLTDAAQAVQRSGHPELYQQWESHATTMTAALMGRVTGAVTCQLREAAPTAGVGSSASLTRELAADLGVAAAAGSGSVSLAVAVRDTTTGWRAAHWFVAKSQGYRVRTVAYAGNVWTAETGKWERDDAAPDARRIEVRLADQS